ncbi:MAG: hypothetical protein PHH48_07835 [Eubacteriales bacterium]|nr:hypothetical protein [Eubacteriales bacterium]
MNFKLVLLSIILFLIAGCNAQAIEISQVDQSDIDICQKSNFELCMDFVNEHPNFELAVFSTDRLFKSNNQFHAVSFDDNHMYYYSSVSGDVSRMPLSSRDLKNQVFIHVFEHGGEKQRWKWMTDNCIPFY